MNKGTILAWLVVVVYLLLAALLLLAFLQFGSGLYVAVSAVLMLAGCIGTVLSLMCRDSFKSPRLVLYLVVLLGGALFTSLPFV